MKTTKQSGFTFVEIILAIGLAALLLPALSRALSFSLKISSQGEKITQANALASEGMEAVYYIKTHDTANWAWTAASPATGQYQPAKTAGIWSLGTVVGSPVAAPGTFTRVVYVSPVMRSGTDICTDPCSDAFAVSDPTTRKVTVVVSFPESVGSQSVNLESYVTQH